MNYLTFNFLLLSFSFMAGIIGALTGLGGGVIIIPILVLVFNLPIHYAMGASLVAILATSSGAAYNYTKNNLINFRVGIFLETITVITAYIGASMIPYLSSKFLMILFSLILFISIYLTMTRSIRKQSHSDSHSLANYLKLNGHYQGKQYLLQHVWIAFGIMGVAGLLAGVLGIGSGAFKVLAMDQALAMPYKVATGTSNFMIGITSAVNTGVYLRQGYILPALIFPIAIGVLMGSFAGSQMLLKLSTTALRIIFCIIIFCVGIQMLIKGLSL